MTTRAEEAAEALAAPPENEAAPPEPPADAVIIFRMTTPDGDIMTDVSTQGNVKADQVQTLIELGLKTWRTKIGLA